MKGEKLYTIAQALEKGMRFCAYQDRCQQDVYRFLRERGMFGSEADEVMIELISQGFVDEERFARSFSRGRFNQKSWGRNKIRAALKQRSISDACIALGLEEIEEVEYINRCAELIQRKWISLESESRQKRIEKCARYLIQRGFESSLVWEEIGKIKDD